MEPGKEAFGARGTGVAIAFQAALRLLFAVSREPGKDQRRERRGERRKQPIGFERQAGLGGLLHVQWITPAGQSIGASSDFGERPLDREPAGLDRFNIIAGCDPYW